MASVGFLDPTKKIARQVGWLNKNAQLKEKISYSDVVEPLSIIDITEAMRILKQLEEAAAQVDTPTQWVVSMAQQSAASSGALAGGAMPKLVPAPSMGGLDPTGKISRQISWLNRNLQLNEQLSFEDLVGPLSTLDITVAMAILKEVEDKAHQLTAPNSYVLSTAQRNGATDGPPPQSMGMGGMSNGHGAYTSPMGAGAALGGAAMQLDPTGKIGRQVGWLNKNVQLAVPVSFSEVVEPLSKLDITSAMAILKEVEQAGMGLADANAYVRDAAAMKMQEMGPIQSSGRVTLDATGKIARQTRWLNEHVQMVEPLRFNEIVEPLSLIDVKDAMAILKDLEENYATITSPSAYVLAAADRVARTNPPPVGGGMGGVPPQRVVGGIPMVPPAMASPMMGGGPMLGGGMGGGPIDPTGKIARQVSWLNANVGLATPLNFSEVAEPLSALNITTAMQILKDVEKQGAQVRNPNGYVVSAANRHGGGAVRASPMLGGHSPMLGGHSPMLGSMTVGGGGGGGLDPTGKISKQITWLNKNVQLMEPLNYHELVQPLSALDVTVAMKILKDVEAQAGSIGNANQYVLNAASKMYSQGGAARPSMSMGVVGMVPPMSSMPGPSPGTKRQWTETARAPDDSDLSKSISKTVGRLNTRVGLLEKLSYSDIKEHLEALPPDTAMKILKDVEASHTMIKQPTNYVIAAAKRALSGEGIPAKRARM